MKIIYIYLILQIICYTKAINRRHRVRVIPIEFPGPVSAPIQNPNKPLEIEKDFDNYNPDVLNNISSARSILDFARIFRLQLPLQPPKPSIDTRVSTGGRTGINNEIIPNVETEELEQAVCKPDSVPVELDLKPKANTVYFPSCVRLPRCGGCCYGSLLSCQPSVEEQVNLQVLEVRTNSPGAPRTVRRRRPRSTNKYITVKETKHVECKCQCKIKEKDCKPSVQYYVKEECACKCKDKDKEILCRRKPDTHIWDSKVCECYCKETQECSSGEYFSHYGCKCVQKETKPIGIQ